MDRRPVQESQRLGQEIRSNSGYHEAGSQSAAQRSEDIKALFGIRDLMAQDQQSCAEEKKNDSGLHGTNDSSMRRSTLHLQRFEQFPSGVRLRVSEQFWSGADPVQQPK